MIRNLYAKICDAAGGILGSKAQDADQGPDPTRRLLLTGAAAVVACGLVAGLPGEAEAYEHGRRRSRRRRGRFYEDDHGRRRSRRHHRRHRGHGRRRSRHWRHGYRRQRCFQFGPVVVCEH